MKNGDIYWIGNWFYMIKGCFYQLRFRGLWFSYSCKQNAMKNAVDAETLEVFDTQYKPAQLTAWFKGHKLFSI